MPLIVETEKTEHSENHRKSLSKINPPLGSLSSDLIRPTEYFVGLYSVNKRRMADSNLAFLVETGAYKAVGIPPCPEGKRYIKVMDIPHPVQWIEADPHNPGEVVLRTQPGPFVAMAIVHPDVVGTSMDHLPPASTLNKVAISSNCDLIKQGVFFTVHDEGTPGFEKALKAAEARLETYYRGLIDSTLGMSEDDARRVMAGGNGLDLRTAAAHFGEEYSWNKRRSPKVDCPNCFEKVHQGAAFHKNELLGLICVIDWVKAVEAGVKTMADVPASKLHLFATENAPVSEGKRDTPDLEELTREQLVEFGATLGLELQARQGKDNLIALIRAKYPEA